MVRGIIKVWSPVSSMVEQLPLKNLLMLSALTEPRYLASTKKQTMPCGHQATKLLETSNDVICFLCFTKITSNCKFKKQEPR